MTVSNKINRPALRRRYGPELDRLIARVAAQHGDVLGGGTGGGGGSAAATCTDGDEPADLVSWALDVVAALISGEAHADAGANVVTRGANSLALSRLASELSRRHGV